MDEANERLTRTGMIFGTPEYMSPEQARGERPDHRVDIYAAGCILYEMLTGDVPFHAETFMGVLTKHMFEPPESPSARAPEANISPEIEAVVLRALAKDRDERFRSMRDFAVALAGTSGQEISGEWANEPSGLVFAPAAPALATARTIVDAEPPRSRAPWFAMSVVGALIGVAVVFAIRRPKPAETTPVPVVAAPPATPTGELKQPPPTVDVAATQHPERQIFTLEISPHDAQVFLGDEVLNEVAPNRYELPYGTEKVLLSLRKPGYVNNTVELTPNHEGTYKKKLVLLPPVHKPSAPPHKQVEQALAPELKPELKPDPPKPKKPASGNSRDLMDPFSGKDEDKK
jgi:eukaryotic-like serine/threonine-protein kinase